VKVKRKKMLARLKSGTINILVCSDALGKIIKKLRFGTVLFLLLKTFMNFLPEYTVGNVHREGGLVAKLVARPLATAALAVQYQTSLNNRI
jgi:hypothetical protein